MDVVLVAVVVLVFATPFLLARMSSHRGVRGQRPRHPFRLPPPAARYADVGDQHGHLDLHSVDDDDPEE